MGVFRIYNKGVLEGEISSMRGALQQHLTDIQNQPQGYDDSEHSDVREEINYIFDKHNITNYFRSDFELNYQVMLGNFNLDLVNKINWMDAYGINKEMLFGKYMTVSKSFLLSYQQIFLNFTGIYLGESFKLDDEFVEDLNDFIEIFIRDRMECGDKYNIECKEVGVIFKLQEGQEGYEIRDFITIILEIICRIIKPVILYKQIFERYR